VLRAVLWKEVREQAAILVALLALGGGLIVAVAQVADRAGDGLPTAFRSYLDAPRVAALMLAATAGVVVGGALFAGEREAGTFGVLELLPAARWAVWRAKVAAGAGIAAVAGGILAAVGAASGAFGAQAVAGWIGWTLAVTLLAYGWGAFGSALRVSRTTLTACGVGLVAIPFAGLAVYLLTTGLLAVTGLDRGPVARQFGGSLAAQATLYLLVVLPVGLSGLVFTAPDRERYATASRRAAGTAARRPGRRLPGGSYRAAVWLAARQCRGYAVGGAVMCGVAGLALLHPELPMLAGWPAVTLFAGVMAGALGWADEQTAGANRFWGERRLPPGRLWAAKVGVGLALALGWCLIALAPNVVRYVADARHEGPAVEGVFRLGLLADAGVYSLYFVFLWPAYGFAFGHLAGLLFRKPVVAVGVGLLTAGPAAGLWIPSLLGGGLHLWQVAGPPLLAVVAARLVMRAWAADRVGSRRPLVTLTAAAMLAVVVSGAAVGYRVAEVEVIPEAGDDLRFAATVPYLDSDDNGREFRRVATLFRQGHPGAGRGLWWGPAAPADNPNTPSEQAVEVCRGGWAAARLGFANWLDAVNEPGWEEVLVKAAGLPPGPIDNPRVRTLFSPPGDADLVHEVAAVTLARGLRMQAAGDPAAFVPRLDAALAASRSARKQQPSMAWGVGAVAEQLAAVATDRWLDALAAGRGDLLAAAAAALARHDALCPRDPAEAFLADRMLVRNTVLAPSEWAPKQLGFELERSGLGDPETVRRRADGEAAVLGFAWAVPWERERLARVVGMGNDPARAGDVARLTRGLYLLGGYARFGSHARPGEWSMRGAADARAAMLKVALRRYALDHGGPPATLDALVPAYLAAVPADPFDRVPVFPAVRYRPFKYRVSAGEWVEWVEPRIPPPAPGPPPRPWPVALPEELQPAVGAAIGGAAFLPQEELDRVAPGPFGRMTSMGPVGGPPSDADAFGAVIGGASGPVFTPVDRRMLQVPAGWGVVWSNGPDGADDGGTVRTQPNAELGRGRYPPADLIYLVPPPGTPIPRPDGGR
jgi:hypothetical protein